MARRYPNDRVVPRIGSRYSSVRPTFRDRLVEGSRSVFAAITTTTARSVRALGYFSMTWAARAGGTFSSFLGRTRIDYATEVGDPTKNSIVVAVVGWVGRNFPEAPVRIARITGSDPDAREYVKLSDTGPGYALALLERPNPYWSGPTMWTAVIVDYYTTGNAFIVKRREGTGPFPDRIRELWWIPRRMLKPVWDPDGREFIDAYEYTVDGRRYYIARRDVIHFRDGIDPLNPRLGLSKLASLFREIYTDDEAANFSARLLTNMAVPGVIISPANTAVNVRADPEAVKKKFEDTFGGDNRGSVLALSSPTEVKPLSWSPEQLVLRDLRKIPEERISAVLGISAIVAGLGAGLDRSTFTNFGEARAAAYEESIIPTQRTVAAELEVQYLNDFVDLSEGWDVDFDLRKVAALQAKRDAEHKRAIEAVRAGVATRADYKAAMGLTATPADDVYLIPNNIIVSRAGSAIPAGPAATPSVTRPGTSPMIPASTNGHDRALVPIET